MHYQLKIFYKLRISHKMAWKSSFKCLRYKPPFMPYSIATFSHGFMCILRRPESVRMSIHLLNRKRVLWLFKFIALNLNSAQQPSTNFVHRDVLYVFQLLLASSMHTVNLVQFTYIWRLLTSNPKSPRDYSILYDSCRLQIADDSECEMPIPS